jgi:hypothetical protein
VSRWQDHLLAGEAICWEGRPAPRAFTFRNWRWSAATLILSLPALALAAAFSVAGKPLPVAAGPGAAVIVGLLFFWGTVGHLLAARLAWEREFYALTDRRLLVKSGRFGGGCFAYCLNDLDGVSTRFLGPSLATVRVRRRAAGRPITLFCLEHPELLLEKLPGQGRWRRKKSVLRRYGVFSGPRHT